MLTLYKSFVRPNLDYTHIVYEKPINESFKRKIEMVHYKAAIIIAAVIKGDPCSKLYHEPGLESLADWRWS